MSFPEQGRRRCVRGNYPLRRRSALSFPVRPKPAVRDWMEKSIRQEENAGKMMCRRTDPRPPVLLKKLTIIIDNSCRVWYNTDTDRLCMRISETGGDRA